MISLNPVGLPSYAIALNATTPVPSEGTGATVWSTTTSSALTWNGSNWVSVAGASGSSGAKGQVTVNFGAFPGASDVQVTVSDTGVLSTSSVIASVLPAATADHSVDEHWLEEMEIRAGNIVAGVGFTIYARTRNTRLYGAWNIGWIRS